MSEKNFVVSVADLLAFDPDTSDFLFSSKANLNTSLEVSMSSTDVRGGFGNKLQYRYYHTRELSATIEATTFEKNFLASNTGSRIATQLEDVYKVDEIVTISSNKGTLKKDVSTANKTVFVTKKDGTKLKSTATGKEFPLVAPDDTKVKVTYQYNTTAEVITIDSGTAPLVLKLILRVPQFDQSGENGMLEIEIPNFQVSGSYSLNLTADGVSTSSMSGTALSKLVDDFDNEIEVYAIIRLIPLNTSDIIYQQIVSSIDGSNLVEASAGSASTYTIKTIGVIGGLFGNRDIPASELSFTATGDGDITVASTGVVSVASSATSGDTSTIKVVHSATNKQSSVIVKVS